MFGHFEQNRFNNESYKKMKRKDVLVAEFQRLTKENNELKEKISNYEETLEKIKIVGGNLFFHNEKLKFQVAKLAKKLKKKAKA